MNGYFQIILKEDGTYLHAYPPTDGGETIDVKEVGTYLEREKINFDLKELNRELNRVENEKEFLLSADKPLPISERCIIDIAGDKMSATIRFYPPSTGGRVCEKEDIAAAFRMQKIVFGVDEAKVDELLKNRQYCTNYDIAKGKLPREGKDAVIEYRFQTDRKIRPTLREDGTVDYYNLNLVNHCKAGDILAVLTPEDRGEPGLNIIGGVIRPKEVNRLTLKYGLNIAINEDKTVLTSMVQGHVSLVDGRVFVSNVLELENVDNSTGNIDYEGTVKIKGNVCTNFSVKARGNIEVNGVVEGAYLESGENIILASGMNGENKGKLIAKGNVIAKFLENCTVSAGGYVETETIVRSNVQAGTDVNVSGRRGFIAGGTVCATNIIRVKNLGTSMGTRTDVIVGVDPELSKQNEARVKELADAEKNLSKLMPMLETLNKKVLSGVSITQEQKRNMPQLVDTVKKLREVIEVNTKEIEKYKEMLENSTSARIEVQGELNPGVNITISDATMIVKETIRYCSLIKEQGMVKVGSL